jgi:hypothetical protein
MRSEPNVDEKGRRVDVLPRKGNSPSLVAPRAKDNKQRRQAVAEFRVDTHAGENVDPSIASGPTGRRRELHGTLRPTLVWQASDESSSQNVNYESQSESLPMHNSSFN